MDPATHTVDNAGHRTASLMRRWSGVTRRLILAAAFLALVCLAIFGIRTTRIQTLQRMVNQDAKIGAPASDVISFLDSRHLEHTALFRPALMNLYGHTYDNESIIVSSKNHTWQSLFQSERLEVVFVFDRDQNLIRFDLFPVYTGL